MKTVSYLPRHPSYFRRGFTQEEIDAAIAVVDRYYRETLSRPRPGRGEAEETAWLRRLGRAPAVVLDSSEKGSGRAAP